MSAVAGWYTDPSGVAGQLRWWDGERWTDHITPDPAFAPAEQPEPAATPQAEAVGEPEPGPEPEVTPEPEVVGQAEPERTPEPEVVAPPEPEPEVVPPPVEQPVADRSPSAPTVPPPGAPPAAGGAVWGSGATDGASATPWAPSTPAPAAAPAWGGTGDAGSGYSGPSSWEPAAPTSSGSGVRTGLIIAAVVGVILVAIVGIVLAGRLVGGVGFTEDDGFGFATGGEVEFGGELTVGGVLNASVPPDGAYEVDLVIEQFSDVTIDVRGRGGFDAVAELVDETGETRAFNDDRGGSGVQRVGGGDLDPLLEVDLEAGTYRLSISGFGGDAGAFEVSVS